MTCVVGRQEKEAKNVFYVKTSCPLLLVTNVLDRDVEGDNKGRVYVSVRSFSVGEGFYVPVWSDEIRSRPMLK